jgi:hypothetical protein
MNPDVLPTPPLILIAPNVSERMGGEAMKAIQIFKFLADRGVDVQQITHSRVRDELSRNYPALKVSYVEEDFIDSLLWRSRIFNYLVGPYFMLRASRMARKRLAAQPGSLVHYTSPISPVAPLFPISAARRFGLVSR